MHHVCPSASDRAGHEVRLSSCLLLVVMPGATSSVLVPSSDARVASSFFLVVMPGATSSVLASWLLVAMPLLLVAACC